MWGWRSEQGFGSWLFFRIIRVISLQKRVTDMHLDWFLFFIYKFWCSSVTTCVLGPVSTFSAFLVGWLKELQQNLGSYEHEA